MRWLTIIWLMIAPFSAVAQDDDDKGVLTRFLESSLSGAGRIVEVDGLRGAISSEATIEEIRISDDDGLWLTLSNITLNWNRLAVLRGNIIVEQLSAERIILPRLPNPGPAPTEIPTAEATPFSLPELPVSIDIAKLSADRIELGKPVLGQAAVLSLDTKLLLDGGVGEALVKATRLEGAEGQFVLDAGFSNADRVLRIDLQANEAQNGIVAGLTRLPGAPAINLKVLGEGQFDDFTADLKLASDGKVRLAGQVVLSSEPADTPGTPATRVVGADISGDMAPLFTPEYQEFFGSNVALQTLARLYADGRIDLEKLSLNTAALSLSGDVTVAAGGLPERFDIKLRLADPDGDRILLPVSGGQTYLKAATLVADFDLANGQEWTLSGSVNAFESGSVDLGWFTLAGQGLIQQEAPRRVTASVSMDMARLDLKDDALNKALGDNGTFSGDVIWQEDQGIKINGFDFAGAGLQVSGDATVTGLGNDLTIGGDVELLASDINRFSDIANRALGGAVEAEVKGTFQALNGGFDVDMSMLAQDLSIDDPRFDTLTKGKSSMVLSAMRDFDGLSLRNFALQADGFDVTADGVLDSNNGDLNIEANLYETAKIVSGVSGPTSVAGNANLTEGDWQFDLDATAPGQTTASVDAKLPKSAQASAVLDLTIGSVETFLPALPGAANMTVSARKDGSKWGVDLNATGPFQTKATGSGLIDPAGSETEFDLTGSLPLAVANRQLAPNSVQGLANYDLRFAGPPELNSLSGTITTNGARFSLPALRAALTDINSSIAISNGSAAIKVSSEFSGGGQISADGTVNLTAPFTANLPIRLTNLAYREGQLLETVVDGPLTISGPLTSGPKVSGDLTLGQTNIRISSAALAGVADIPEIKHVGASQRVQSTRQKAGLIKEEKGSSASSAPIELDLTVRTGQRISVRGMGLNADFDGSVQLAGNTNNVVTQGELDLIRGRMDFLTKTFEIDEGIIRLQGDLVPWMRVQATSEQKDATIRIILEGRLDDPEIILESDPELPEDEVLSQLLFGRDLSSISGLQAAQLAAALASLSGNGPARPRLGENAGLDELSLTFDESGTPGVRAGKYINENVYTELEANSRGESSISLNLDVTNSLTVKGRVDSDSDTGVGLFFQRDY